MNLTNVPYVKMWWDHMPTVMFAFQIVCFVIVFLLFLMTIKMIYNIYMCVGDEYIRNDLYWLMCSPFFVAFTCMLGNIIPRSAGLLYAIGLTYLMVCLYTAVDLTYKIFGGTKEFSNWLRKRNLKIPFTTPPFCCCCKCLPEAEPTPENLQRLKYFVEQSPAVRIIIQIALIMLSLERVPDSAVIPQVLNGMGVVSTLLGVYITHIMLKLTGDSLNKFGVNRLFRCADYTQMMYTILKFVIDLIAKNGHMGSAGDMSSEAIGDFWFNVAMIISVLLPAGVQFFYLRPGKSALFDQSILLEAPPISHWRMTEQPPTITVSEIQSSV